MFSYLFSGGFDFSLNVSYNLISTLNSSMSPINLTRLDLSFNNLSNLPMDVFRNIPNLRAINLQSNYLRTVEPGNYLILFFYPNNIVIIFEFFSPIRKICPYVKLVYYNYRVIKKKARGKKKCFVIEIVLVLASRECFAYAKFKIKILKEEIKFLSQ